nr:putative zinc finger, CCHC-type [Tanacetum cinerariifolium]
MRTRQRLQSSEDVPTLLSPEDVKDAISSEKKQRDDIKVIYNLNKDVTRKITIGVKSSDFVNMRIGDDSEISTRWQKKMHFLLTTLKVVYVLSTPMLEFVEDEPLEQTRRRCKWKNDDYIYCGHILNGMSDALFDVYQNVGSTKELWDQLESKYMAEDASSKKFLVCNFNNYKLVDSRSVMEKYHELFRILG